MPTLFSCSFFSDELLLKLSLCLIPILYKFSLKLVLNVNFGVTAIELSFFSVFGDFLNSVDLFSTLFFLIFL
jgi:hypothetical protein